MRSNNERIAALHRRAEELEQKKTSHRIRALQACSVIGSFVAIVFLSSLMPGFSSVFDSEDVSNNLCASVFSQNVALGYIVIGIVSFLLGVFVAIFNFRLKQKHHSHFSDQKKNQ